MGVSSIASTDDGILASQAVGNRFVSGNKGMRRRILF